MLQEKVDVPVAHVVIMTQLTTASFESSMHKCLIQSRRIDDVPVAHVVVMTKKLQEDASIIPVCPLKHLFIFLPGVKPSDFGKTKPFYHHTFFLLIIVFF